MMSFEMVMELLASLGDDVDVRVDSDGDVHVEVQDFEGFDDDWSEIERECSEAVDEVEAQLEEACLHACGDYYRYYEFDGFVVVWGYASMDV